MTYNYSSRTVSTRVGWTMVTRRISTDGSGYPARCNPAVVTVTRSPLSLTNSVTYGSDILDYKRMIAEGNSATTGLTGIKYRAGWSPFKYQHRNRLNGCLWAEVSGAPDVAMPTLPGAAFPSDTAEFDAARAFAKSYTQKSRSYRGGNAIVELVETIRMFTHPIKSIYTKSFRFTERLRRIRHLAIPHKLRYRQYLTDAFLQYQLGIAPLMSDAAELRDAIANLANDLGSKTTERIVGNGHETVQNELITGQFLVGGVFARQNRLMTTNYSVRYTGAFRCVPPGVPAVQASFGLGWQDVLPAVWEAIPFSFVLDYFSNCGAMIEGLAFANAQMAWMQKTTRIDRVRKATAAYPDVSSLPFYDIDVTGGAYYAGATRVNRTAITLIPYPRFQFKLPGMESLAWLNVAALASAFARTRPPVPRRPRVSSDNGWGFDVGNL